MAGTTRAPVTVRVPGKVNLHLRVGDRRPDGFHDVVTVLQAVSLYDDVTAASGPGTTIEVHGEGAADVPTDGTNLAVRAARLLAERAHVDPAVHLTLHKGIPVAGGMAGGSADAAGALVACDALWRTGFTRTQLGVLAAELGSDVPFSLAGGTVLATGRGEVLSPVLTRGSCHWVFALAPLGLSTASVYAEHDRLGPLGHRPGTVRADGPDGVLVALRQQDCVAVGKSLRNDLQAAALRLRPELRETVDAAADLGALGAVVSGSGPTVALLARDHAAAVELAGELVARGLCATVRQASGPVHGARVHEEVS